MRCDLTDKQTDYCNPRCACAPRVNQLCELPEESRVTIRVVVVKVNEPQQVRSGKIKQDIIVADNTNKAAVTLWQPYLNILKAQCSYQLNRLQIKTYQGKRHLSAPSIDEIENIEDPIEVFTSSDEEIHLKPRDNFIYPTINIHLSNTSPIIHIITSCSRNYILRMRVQNQTAGKWGRRPGWVSSAGGCCGVRV